MPIWHFVVEIPVEAGGGTFLHGVLRFAQNDGATGFVREGILIARILAGLLLLLGSAVAQDVVRYTTTTANVKYLFATAEPVLRLKSGDIPRHQYARLFR